MVACRIGPSILPLRDVLNLQIATHFSPNLHTPAMLRLHSLASKTRHNALLKSQPFLKTALFSTDSAKVFGTSCSSLSNQLLRLYKTSILSQDLEKVDPKLFNIMELEKQRQRESIVLIPSEVDFLIKFRSHLSSKSTRTLLLCR